jgi:DNA-directed RNA polymerase subunit RPC12/RpoP
MADVMLKCDRCGKTVTVSEFVDREAIACRECGGKLIRPGEQDAPSRRRFTIKPPMAQHEERSADRAEPRLSPEVQPAQVGPARRRPLLRFRHVAAGWALFALVGGFLAWVRYGGGPAPAWLREALRPPVGPLVILGFHLLIVLRAFKESFFHGILCALVPFYSFYYLFLVTDAFYLRALCAAWLVGTVQDAVGFYQQWLQEVIRTVDAFIASGGGEVR